MKRLITVLALICLLVTAAWALRFSATSLSLATATGAGSSFELTDRLMDFTWTVTFKSAAPTAQTTNLEGSIDGTNWYTLDSSTNLSYTSDTVSGEMRHVINKRVRYVRCNVSAYTQGGNAGITCKIYALTVTQ